MLKPAALALAIVTGFALPAAAGCKPPYDINAKRSVTPQEFAQTITDSYIIPDPTHPIIPLIIEREYGHIDVEWAIKEAEQYPEDPDTNRPPSARVATFKRQFDKHIEAGIPNNIAIALAYLDMRNEISRLRGVASIPEPGSVPYWQMADVILGALGRDYFKKRRPMTPEQEQELREALPGSESEKDKSLRYSTALDHMQMVEIGLSEPYERTRRRYLWDLCR